MKLFKRKENKKVYKIAFCDTCDISTKFGEEHVDYSTYEAAKNAIFSKNAGWGQSFLKKSLTTSKKMSFFFIHFSKLK